MKILITGGTGFAGSHLTEELLRQGYSDIYSTTYTAPDPKYVFLPADHYIQVNLTDREQTKKLFETVRPDWVFHLASFAYVGKSFEKAPELFANNISLQLSVLDAAREVTPHAKILIIGSAEEYGVLAPDIERVDESVALNPVNPYAVSKVTQDLLANSYFLSYKTQIIRARPFNHIGIRQTAEFAIPTFVKQIVAIERGEQETLQVGNLNAIRDFSSVKDIVKAYILLMEKGVIGDIYNIGSGHGYQMKEIVTMLSKLSHENITWTQDEKRLRPLDVPRMVADNRKMKALGWEPTIPLEEELQRILEEWRNT